MSTSGRQRGFNAAKKGSGQVGFQSAPPVGAEPPTAATRSPHETPPGADADSAVNELDEQYERFTALLSDEPEAGLDGLTAEEQAVVLASRERIRGTSRSLVDSSPETADTVTLLSREWGLNDADQHDALTVVDASTNSDDPMDFEYVDSAVAAEEIRSLAHGAPFNADSSGGMLEFVERVRSGDVLLSRRELDGLAAFRDAAHQVVTANRETAERDRLGAEWVSSAVNRRCELCGQFISTRDMHGNMYVAALSTDYDARHEENRKIRCQASYHHQVAFGSAVRRQASTRTGTAARTRDLNDSNDFAPDATLNEPVRLPKAQFDDLAAKGYSLEKIEDIYMGHTDERASVIALFADKQGFLDRRIVISLPENIRNAVLEAPPRPRTSGQNQGMLALAARVEPPFNEYEIKRLIDRGDGSVLHALLSTRRTRETAARIVSDYPSEALREMSLSRGSFPAGLLSQMASSGDPLVRTYAAGSPDLSEDDATRLSTDPDPRVRRALIVPHRTTAPPDERLRLQLGAQSALSRHKSVGATLINDPDSEIAVMAFTHFHGWQRYAHKRFDWSRYREQSAPPEGFTTEQKFLISKIRSRERFNELKRHVMNPTSGYDLSDPDVMRFLAR